jgi:phosphoglycolate phosphatase-like HAD superfamily hydrolase
VEPLRPGPFSRTDALICDVDGTLVDVSDVRSHVESPSGDESFKPNFERFHSDSINSPAHENVIRLIDHAHACGLTILIVTGREQKWSFLTTTWLTEHGVPYDELIMRSRNDNRPDVVVKTEMVRSIALQYNVRLAIDDRPSIVEVWHRAGIPTALVTASGSLGALVWPAGEEPEEEITALIRAALPGHV